MPIKSLNISETKFVPASVISLLGSLYSGKIILHVFIRFSALSFSTCLFTGNSLC